MKFCGLPARLTLGLLVLTGCGADPAPTEPEPLDIEGSWLYLGPSDGPHTLKIGRTSVDYADVGGTWSSKWTITARDNGLRRYTDA